MKKLILSAILFLAIGSAGAQNLKFAIISDLHHDLVFDAPQRLEKFFEASRKAKVDFIIDLGDFAFAKPENQPIFDQWNNCEFERYNALGNHDMDVTTKEQHMKYAQMKSRYYSFEKEGVLFIVLDPNNINVDGKISPYGNSNFYIDSKQRTWIDPEQVEWLQEEVKRDFKRIIIFSHQSLEVSVANREEVRAILEGENQRVGYTKIPVALCGHDHTDYQKEINGIVYVQLNSASYIWLGDKFAHTTRFTPEQYEQRYNLRNVATYKDPLYCIVTLKENSLTIKGTKTEFTYPSLEELGVPEDLYGWPLTPTISDRKIKF